MSVQAWSYCHAHKSWGDIMVRALNSLILSSPTYERGNSSSRVPLKRIWYASSLQGISPFPNWPDLLFQKLDVCYNLPSNYPCRWMLLCLSPAVWGSSKMPTLMDWRSHSSKSPMVAHSNLCRIPIRNTTKKWFWDSCLEKSPNFQLLLTLPVSSLTRRRVATLGLPLLSVSWLIPCTQMKWRYNVRGEESLQ